MRDLDSPHVTGEMLIEQLRREGFTVTDLDPTEQLPIIDAPLAARVHHELSCDTLELEA